MTTLTEFLTARLDEDEAVAREAMDDKARRWTVPGVDDDYATGAVHAGAEIVVYAEGRPYDEEAEHIARHDPARVLAEVEAKRRIVEMHGSYSQTYYDKATDMYGSAGVACEYCWDPGGDYDSGRAVPWPCETLRLLALPYADHPSYDEAWRV